MILLQYSLIFKFKDGARIEVFPESGLVSVNGNQVELPTTVAGQVTLVRRGHSVLIDDHKGFSAECNQQRDLCTFFVG